MTQATNTFDTYDAAGEREDLQDMIYDISPMETPFSSGVSRGTARAVYHEWQTDALAAAAANAQIEGDDIAGASLAATTRVGNYCQISRKAVTISGTLDAVDKAGRKSETAYQVMKAGKELKRDIEYAVVRNQASEVGGTGGTARTTAGVESWLSTNKYDNGAGTTAGFSSGTVAAPTDGTARTVTEALLKTTIQGIWTQGGDPKVLMVGPVTKGNVSAFSGIATKYKEVKEGQATIVGGADLYVSDFGEHTVVPNRFSRDRTLLALDMDYWSIAFLRPIFQKELAATGDAEKRALIAEYALCAKNEAASGKLADLIIT